MPEPPAPTITTSNLRLVILEVAVMIYIESRFLDATSHSLQAIFTNTWEYEFSGRFLQTPQDLNAPARATDQPDDGKYVQDKANAVRMDVVLENIAHANPDVVEQGEDDGEG